MEDVLEMTEVLPAGCQAWFARVVGGSLETGRTLYASTLEVYVLRLRDASVERVIPAHTKTIVGMDLHPLRPDLVATGGLDARLRVFSVGSGATVAELDLEDTQPTVLGWRPHTGQLEIAFATKDGDVRLWAVPHAEERGEEVEVRVVDENEAGAEPTALAWEDGDAQRLAMGRADGSIGIHSVIRNETVELSKMAVGSGGDGEGKEVEEGESGAVTCLKFSPHGPYLIAAYRDGTLSLFDVSLAGPLREVHRFDAQPQAVLSLEWLPWAPGTFLTLDGRSGAVRVWNASQKHPTGILDVAGDDGIVGFALLHTQPSTTTESKPPHTPPLSWPFHAQFIPPASPPSSTSSPLPTPPPPRMAAISVVDGSVLTADLTTGQVHSRTAPGHVEAVFGLEWHPSDADTFATCSFDGSSKIWHTPSGRCALTLLDPEEGIVQSIAWSPSGTYLATVTHQGALLVWNVQSGSPDMHIGSLHSKTITSVAWGGEWSGTATRSGRIATGSDDGTVAIVSALTAAEEFRIDEPLAVRAVAWVRGSCTTLATGCIDRIVRIYNVPPQPSSTQTSSGAPELVRALRGHSAPITSLRWNPLVPALLASGDKGGEVHVWDVTHRDRSTKMQDTHDGEVKALSWCFELPWLLHSGGVDGGIRGWDVRGGDCIGGLSGSSAVYAIDSHPLRPFQLASTGQNASIRQWSISPPLLPALRCDLLGAAMRTSIPRPPTDFFLAALREAVSPHPLKSLRARDRVLLCGAASARLLAFFEGGSSSSSKSGGTTQQRIQRLALLSTFFYSAPCLETMWEMAADTILLGSCTTTPQILDPLRAPLHTSITPVAAQYTAMGAAGVIPRTPGAAAGPGVRGGGASGAPPWATAAEAAVLAGGAYSRGGHAAPTAWGGGRAPISPLRHIPSQARKRALALLAYSATAGASGVGKHRPESLRLAAAALALSGLDIGLYCEALAQAGAWEEALAAAPAAGIKTWRALCRRRARAALKDARVADVTLPREGPTKGITLASLSHAIPLLVAAGDLPGAVHLLATHGEPEGALALAAASIESTAPVPKHTHHSTKPTPSPTSPHSAHLPAASPPPAHSTAPTPPPPPFSAPPPPPITPKEIASQMTLMLADEALQRGEPCTAAAHHLACGELHAAIHKMYAADCVSLRACLALAGLPHDDPVCKHAVWCFARACQRVGEWDASFAILTSLLHASPLALALEASRYVNPEASEEDKGHGEGKGDVEDEWGWLDGVGEEEGKGGSGEEEEEEGGGGGGGGKSKAFDELRKRWKLPGAHGLIREAAKLRAAQDYERGLAFVIRARHWGDAAVIGTRMIRHALGQGREATQGWDLGAVERVVGLLGFVPLDQVHPSAVRLDAIACTSLGAALVALYHIHPPDISTIQSLFHLATKASEESEIPLPISRAEIILTQAQAYFHTAPTKSLHILQPIAEEWRASEKEREELCIAAAEHVENLEKFNLRQEARKKRGVRAKEAPPPPPKPAPLLEDNPETWAKVRCAHLYTTLLASPHSTPSSTPKLPPLFQPPQTGLPATSPIHSHPSTPPPHPTPTASSFFPYHIDLSGKLV